MRGLGQERRLAESSLEASRLECRGTKLKDPYYHRDTWGLYGDLWKLTKASLSQLVRCSELKGCLEHFEQEQALLQPLGLAQTCEQSSLFAGVLLCTDIRVELSAQVVPQSPGFTWYHDVP